MKMTENEFVEKYVPLRPYETFGEQFAELRKHDVHKIWTIIDDNEGHQYLVNGLHLMNRVCHYVTENAWKYGDDIIVELD